MTARPRPVRRSGGARRDQGRIGEARDLLEATYGRFSEGFATADLRLAKSRLDELTA